MDAIAGGGGIITLPTYYVVGLPPHMAMGTNKFSSSFGTAISSIKFIKSRNVHFKAAAVSVPCALLGSACGSWLTLFISAETLRYILLVALPLLAVFLLRGDRLKDGSEKNLPLGKLLFASGIIAFALGAYDGFFGPGTGTFLIIAFNLIAGFNILTAAGNAKIVNFSSNIAALVTFLLSGNIVFALGVPAAACSLAGSWLGASVALKSGAKIIKPMFIFVFVLLLIKITWDMLG
jgi:uncharacterized membrane protein YfcA